MAELSCEQLRQLLQRHLAHCGCVLQLARSGSPSRTIPTHGRSEPTPPAQFDSLSAFDSALFEQELDLAPGLVAAADASADCRLHFDLSLRDLQRSGPAAGYGQFLSGLGHETPSSPPPSPPPPPPPPAAAAAASRRADGGRQSSTPVKKSPQPIARVQHAHVLASGHGACSLAESVPNCSLADSN